MTSAALAGLLAAVSLAAPAQAASLSYYLDQSNALSNGVNYLQVQVADGLNGAIDFTVQVLSPLSSIAGSNFGIQSFAFNVVPGGSAEAINVTGLPSGWKATNSSRMDGFGFFDIQLQATGNARLQTLTFSVTGISGDRPEDYAILSTGNASGGQQFFAAHVAGFQYCSPGPDGGGGGSGCGDAVLQPLFSVQTASAGNSKANNGKNNGPNKGKGKSHGDGWAWQRDWRNGMDQHWDGDWVKDCITSGFFAGSTAVPLPGTAWLFLAGAAGVLTRVRRRARA